MKRLFVTVFVVFALAFTSKADVDIVQVDMNDPSPMYVNSCKSFTFPCGFCGEILDYYYLPRWKDRATVKPFQYWEFSVYVNVPYNGYPKNGVSQQEYEDHIMDYYYAFLNDIDVGLMMNEKHNLEVAMIRPIKNYDGTMSCTIVGCASPMDPNKGYYVDVW